MRTVFKTLLFALPLALPALSLAQQSSPPDHVPVGAVETVYVKVAHGVFMEVRLARVKNPVESWSDVRVRQAGADKPRNELAKNPEGVTINQGDVVQLTMGTPPEFSTGPLQEVTRVTERLAPAGSELARRFEQQQQAVPAMTLAEQSGM